MKKDKKELNVDYIGGETPMTLTEEKELSEYLKKKNSDLKNSTKKGKLKSDKKSKANS